MITKVIKKNEKVCPFGGIYFVMNEIKKKGLSKLIDSSLGERVKQARYSYSDIMLNWIFANMCGAERLEDIEKIREHFEFKLPSHDVIGRTFKSLSTKTKILKSQTKHSQVKHQFNIHLPLNRLMLDMGLKLNMLKSNKPYTLDYDNTIIENLKHDCTKTYRFNYGYQPGVAFIDKIPVYIEGRNGNSNAITLMRDTLKRCLDLLEEKNIKIDRFRSDSAACQHEIIELMEEKKIKFYIRLVRNKNFNEKVEANIDSWEKINDSEKEVGGGIYTSRNLKYRMVVIREIKNNKYEYRAILTNDFEMSNKQVIYFYNQRGAIEKNFDTLKNDFNWRRLPFSFLNENTVFMIVGAIASIIYQYIIINFSKKIDFVKRKFRLKNFIYHFVICSVIFEGGVLQMFTDRNYKPLLE